ncbi:endonuclease [Flavobacterium sp. '19STA2R22 D10 B1']|uniref:endonuclease n=1 Tax=Flavobacterium aerium TaxID=3037261 RepID=UPI00278BF8D7|nr:endonuclease [Flavobacterium sp. '19STA2R22 D10 B1']
MKQIYTLTMLMLTTLAFAQIPAGYYNNATGTGYALKTQLKTIITNGHNPKSYNALWTLYANNAYKDLYYENDNTLLDFYSEKPAGPDSYTFNVPSNQCGSYTGEGSCYNREHVMPQSVFNEASPMVSDAHHIFPTDGYVNGKRNNYAFGKVNSPTWTSTNGSKLGPNTNSGYSAGYSGVVFEPIDEFKGDIARVLLYMATRYEGVIAGWNDHEMLNHTSNQVFSDWSLSVLLTWNNQDPVSDRERAINNAIYTHQGNRNPYIDHPEYVAQIWGTLGVDTYENLASVSIYPNPSNDHRVNIHSEQPITEIQLININGQIMQQIKNPVMQNNATYSLDNLPQGFYFVKLSSDNRSVTKKIIVN